MKNMNHWTIKVNIRHEDPESGKIQTKKETYLVAATTIEKAHELVHKHFRGLTLDYEIAGSNKSNILEYIKEEDLNYVPRDEYEKILKS